MLARAPRMAILLLLSLAPLFARAERNLSAGEVAQKFEAFRQLTRLRVGFRQTKLLRDLDLKLESAGQLSLDRPGPIVWELRKPSPLKATLTHQEIRLESGEAAHRSVQVFRLDQLSKGQRENSGLGALMSLLSFDVKPLLETYRVIELETGRYRFVPLDSSKKLETLEMRLSKAGVLSELRINEKSGDLLEIHFDAPSVVKRSS